MILDGRRFKPAWWSIVLTVAGMALFISLGLWQLDRAALKEAIEARFQQRLAEDYQVIWRIGSRCSLILSPATVVIEYFYEGPLLALPWGR